MKRTVSMNSGRECPVQAKDMSNWLVGAVLCLFACALLAGCGQGTQGRQEGDLQASGEPKTSTNAASDVVAGVSTGDASTTDALAAIGWAVLASPTEIRVYVDPDFPGSKIRSLRGTATIDDVSSVPAPLQMNSGGQFMVALFPTEIKPPVPVLLKIEADGYPAGETTITLEKSLPKQLEPEKVFPTADNPKEFSSDLEAEMARLAQAIDSENLDLAQQLAESVAKQAEGLAMTSRLEIEIALQPAVGKLNTASASIAAAAKSKNPDDAREAYELIRDVFEKDIKPYLVK